MLQVRVNRPKRLNYRSLLFPGSAGSSLQAPAGSRPALHVVSPCILICFELKAVFCLIRFSLFEGATCSLVVHASVKSVEREQVRPRQIFELI